MWYRYANNIFNFEHRYNPEVRQRLEDALLSLHPPIQLHKAPSSYSGYATPSGAFTTNFAQQHDDGSEAYGHIDASVDARLEAMQNDMHEYGRYQSHAFRHDPEDDWDYMTNRGFVRVRLIPTKGKKDSDIAIDFEITEPINKAIFLQIFEYLRQHPSSNLIFNAVNQNDIDKTTKFQKGIKSLFEIPQIQQAFPEIYRELLQEERHQKLLEDYRWETKRIAPSKNKSYNFKTANCKGTICLI